jgi:hypothetical protein
MNLRQ